MKKSFKKAIAVLLAVLMVAFSVPFTALAAAGDYQPNVYLKFGTFHDANNTWQGYDVTASGADFSMCGLYDVPLDYNNGTITMSAEKAAKADEILGTGAAPSEDYTYGVGDYFTVTTVLENVDRYWACNAFISYSDNIEPAGYYSYKSGRNTKWTVGTVSEAAAVSGTFALGGTKPVANMSANEFTPDINIMGGEVDDSSFINLDKKRIESSNVNCNGKDYADISSIYNEFFADPATGDLSSGYTYTNSIPMETFVFKITGEGPITFDVADPYDTIGAFEGTYFIGQKSDGVMTKDYTTYTPNFGTNAGHDASAGTENPGSCKMTVFGKNIHVTTECDHATTEVRDAKAATCIAKGYTGDTYCTKCGEKIATGTETAIDPNNHVNTEVINAKEATCAPGYTGDTYCASCDVKLADGTVIPATGEHNYVEVPGSAVEPSYEAPGKEADKECSVCGDKITGATIPALKGLAVTVVANDRGAATINGQAVTTEDVTVNVAQNSQVTLTATPNAGVKFVGWSVNGKLVSTEANATITALANMTIEPVYQVVGEEFTVIFMDKFGNVISTQVVKSAAEIIVPAVPVIDGYTDAAWSLTADQIAALTESTIIKATYGTAAEKTYTVKAAGATITTPYATAQDVNAGIKYNTLVTVTADGAKAWEMNGKTVAYGDTYSFYVGSDVTLVPVFDGVIDAKPTVAAVSTTKVGSEGAYKASFLATRSMTADCTYVNAGFVYAVNPASNELTLADVNGSTVLAAYCSTDSDQFALTVGRQSQTGVIVARAFIAYVDAAGATQVAYAEPQTFDYSAIV